MLQWARHRNSACNAGRSIERKVVQATVEREAPRRVDGFVQLDEACRRGERNRRGTDCGAPGVRAFVVASRVSVVKPPNRAITPDATPPRPGTAAIADSIRPRCCRGRCKSECAGNLGRNQVGELSEAFTERRTWSGSYMGHASIPVVVRRRPVSVRSGTAPFVALCNGDGRAV